MSPRLDSVPVAPSGTFSAMIFARSPWMLFRQADEYLLMVCSSRFSSSAEHTVGAGVSVRVGVGLPKITGVGPGVGFGVGIGVGVGFGVGFGLGFGVGFAVGGGFGVGLGVGGGVGGGFCAGGGGGGVYGGGGGG